MFALFQRLEHDEHASLIECRTSTSESNDCVHFGVLLHDIHKSAHFLTHRTERNVLRSLDCADDAPNILLREETFGNDDVQVNCQTGSKNRDDQRKWLMAEHPLQ